MKSLHPLCLPALILLAAFPTALPAQQTAYDGGIVIDYSDRGYSEGGAWETVTGNYYTSGQSWTDVRRSGQAGAWAQWAPNFQAPGKYRVFFWHVPSNDKKTKIEIRHNGKTETITKSMEDWHLGWSSLGDYDFSSSGDNFVRITRGEGKLLVDSVKFLPVEKIRPLPVLPPYPKPDGSVPHLDVKGNLILSGKPYLPLYQELTEATVSKPELIPTFDEAFDKALAQGVNTLGVTIMWKLFEPSEGQYDYRVIDVLIDKARERRMHLDLILFFAWRNLQSYYVPTYISKNTEKYPPLKKKGGGGNYVQSPFSETLKEAETKALQALFRRVKEKDPDHQVVIMAQLENEMPGMRDFSEVGLQAWNSPVPPELLKFVQENKGIISRRIWEAWHKNGEKTAGTWEEVFGNTDTADRIFGAWTFGRYVDDVASAIKKELPIPLYQNAWRGESPCYHNFMDVFHAAAPNLDGMGPDAYGNLETWESDVGRSVRPWTHLFIAEQHHSIQPLWRAIANYNAIISGEYFGVEGSDWLCSNETYKLLEEMAPLICEKRGSGDMFGFMQGRRAAGESWSEYFQNLKLTFTPTVRPHTWNQFDKENPAPSEKINNITGGELDGCGLLISLGNGEYVITSTRTDLTLSYINGGPIPIANAEKGHFQDGVWKKDGTAEIRAEKESVRLVFPSANRQYAQIRFRLSAPAANPAHAFEFEKGKLLNNCNLEYDRSASGAFYVTKAYRPGDGVEVPTQAGFDAKAVTIRYAAESPCRAALKVNGENAINIDFPETGSWTNWTEITQSVNVPKGAVVSLEFLDKSPNGPSLDCLILSASVPAGNSQ